MVRVGGALMLASMAIHIAANVFIKEMPAPDLTPSQVAAYLESQRGAWGVVHGMRYAAIVGMAAFYAGLFVFAGRGGRGWEVVGLVGGVLHIANLMIANGLEMLAMQDFSVLSGNAELFWLAYAASRRLFDAELVTWAIAMTGFGLAGWRAGVLPLWLAGVGWLSAMAALVSCLFIYVMLDGGWAALAAEVASVVGLVWFLGVGVIMVVKGAAR